MGGTNTSRKTNPGLCSALHKFNLLVIQDVAVEDEPGVVEDDLLLGWLEVEQGVVVMLVAAFEDARILGILKIVEMFVGKN